MLQLPHAINMIERQRTQFPITKKKEIVTYKTNHPKATQDEIAAHFARDWGNTGLHIVSAYICIIVYIYLSGGRKNTSSLQQQIHFLRIDFFVSLRYEWKTNMHIVWRA